MNNYKNLFLSSKLYFPEQINDIVKRSILLEKLNSIPKKKLTIVSAPAGYGKSTLLSAWIADNTAIPACWYSLDERDNDPAVFLSYLILTLQKINNNFGSSIFSLLQSPNPPTTDTIMMNLVNEISESFKEFMIVIDDYHLIENNQIHDIVQFLIKYLPAQFHIIIITRSDPPLSIARLRAKNEILELRSKDLRFENEEIKIYYNEILNLALAPAEIEVLENKTDGWIAGLQLAGLSLIKNEDRSQFIKSFSGNDQYIIDFLVEEVLKNLEQEVVDFLLQTSILDTFNCNLCDTMTGNSNSNNIIDILEKNNLFVIRLDNERHNYRYHHLFRDLLKQRLLLTPGYKIKTLNDRAGQWFEENNYINEAVHYYLKAYNYESTARIIEKNSWNLLMKMGITGTLLKWLDQLPESIIQKSVPLNLAYAWTYFIQINTGKIENYLNTASGLLHSDPDNEYWGEIETIRGTLYIFTGRTNDAIQLFQKALKRKFHNDLDMRGIILLGLGYAYIVSDNNTEAVQVLKQSASINNKTGFIGMAIKSLGFAGYAQLYLGNLNEAFHTFEKGLRLAEESGMSGFPVTTIVSCGLAEYHREKNELKKAMGLVEKSIDTCRTGGEQLLLWNKLLIMADIMRTSGTTGRAYDYIEEAQSIIGHTGMKPWIIRTLSFKIYLHLCSKTTQPAIHEIEKFQIDFEPNPGWFHTSGAMMLPGMSCDFEYFVLCRAYILEDNYEEALKIVDMIIVQAEKVYRIRSLIKAKVLKSMIYYCQKDFSNAFNILIEALRLGEDPGFINIFLEEGKIIQDMLAGILKKVQRGELKPENGPTGTYLNNLLLFSKSDNKLYMIENEFIENLSEREIEVLKSIASGLSNQEMSDNLFISLNTVKTHLKNINKKLSAKNRTDAIRKARSLGLI